MISIGQRLERNIYYLDDLIASNSVPLIPEVNITYANKMQDLSNDLFAIARNKALLLRGVSGDTILTGIFERNSDHNKGFLKNLQTYFRQLKDLFRGNVKRVRNSFEDLSYLEDWERKYFPDFDEKIKIIVADHTDKQAELTEINNQIESVQADTNTKKILRENELEKLHTDIDKWRIIIFKSLSHKIERIDDFRMISLEKETNILDGFHLGIWYRENKMGPLDNYFTSCIKMNGNGVKST